MNNGVRESRPLHSSMSMEREHVLVSTLSILAGEALAVALPLVPSSLCELPENTCEMRTLAGTEFVGQKYINERWSSWIPQTEFLALEVKKEKRTEGFAV